VVALVEQSVTVCERVTERVRRVPVGLFQTARLLLLFLVMTTTPMLMRSSDPFPLRDSPHQDSIPIYVLLDGGAASERMSTNEKEKDEEYWIHLETLLDTTSISSESNEEYEWLCRLITVKSFSYEEYQMLIDLQRIEDSIPLTLLG